MLAPIPEHPTHGQMFLIKKIQERNLVQFTKEIGLDEIKDHKLLYKLALGVISPNFGWVYSLREIIPPIWWFRTADIPVESLPKLEFNPIHKDYDMTHKTMGHLLAEKTLQDVIGGIPALSEQTGVKKTFYYQALGTMSKDGETVLRMRPSPKLVTLLAPWVREDMWYVYPDEVGKPELYKKL